MSKIKFDELAQGSVIVSKKSGQSFEVSSINNLEKKVSLVNLDTKVDVTLSSSTVERWYTIEEKVEVDEKPKAPAIKPKRPSVPVVGRKGRVAPKPKIEEEIPTETEVEEVKSTADVPKKQGKKPAPKKESLMALTKKLEARIQEDFPHAQRVVNITHVVYRAKKNFVTVEESSKGLAIGVRTSGMKDEVKAKLTKIAPKKYGWAIDGTFKILTEDDLDTALMLIQESHQSTL